MARLTERQIVEWYFHARDKGVIRRPPPPQPGLTEEEHVRRFRAQARWARKQGKVTREQVEAKVAEIRAAWARKRARAAEQAAKGGADGG